MLTGRIVERQRDARTREWKYVVLGAVKPTTLTKVDQAIKISLGLVTLS